MTLILIGLLLFLFSLIVGEYGWRGAVLFTILSGFLQDPIRKLSEIDSSYYAAISLFFFILTFFILRSRFKSWDLELFCWPNPIIISLLPAFFYLLILQGLNSFVRFNDIRLTTVGILFYILPLISLWIGYQVACDLRFLRKVLIFYVSICALTGLSIFFSLLGLENNLLKEVGTGIEITGTGQGYSGLWRTSEIAGWHLAAGASFSFILGMSESKGFKQILFFLITCSLTFLTIPTGRRKSLGLIIIFIALYFLYYSLTGKSNRITKALGSLICVVILSVSSYGLVFNPNIQNTLEPFFDRSSTLTIEESQDRVRVQGIGAVLRGLEIAGPLGFGVGVGSNAGTTNIGSSRSNIQSLGYVSEGGGGRLILELGSIGIAFFSFLIIQVIVLYIKIFSLSRYLVVLGSDIVLGLALFTLANVVTFLSASQLYSDPFILIVLGLCSGAILAIPRIYLNTQSSYSKEV
ncbi:MAG: hypothetical protein ACK587_07560 [Cyanobacteriota bacterium]|jgi:hypothetical protein